MSRYAASFLPLIALIVVLLAGATLTVVKVGDGLSHQPPGVPEVVKDLIRSGDGKTAITLRSTPDAVRMNVSTNKRSLELSCVTGGSPRLTFYHNGEPVMYIETDEVGDASVSFRRGGEFVTAPEFQDAQPKRAD